jgi:hypothetical protein
MIRPSATRYGQRVDNPNIDTSATGEVRSLVKAITQDDRHDQSMQNADFDRRLKGNHHNWLEVDKLKLGDLKTKVATHGRDLFYHWIAIVALGGMVFDLYRRR